MIEKIVHGDRVPFSDLNRPLDNVPTEGSANPVKSGGIYAALEEKVDKFSYDTPINYCPVPEYSSNNIYGVTFTKNVNGTITVNGTNSGYSNSLYNLTNTTGTDPTYSLQLEAGVQYKLTGCPEGGSSTTYLITLSDGTTTLYDKGSGVTFTASANPYIVQIGVIKNAAVDSLVFSPMIKKLSDYEEDSTFVPYIPTNKQANTNAIDKNTGAIKALTLATSKNLAKMKYYDGTTESMGGGLSATYNSDGTITISEGTASAQAYIFPASHGDGQLNLIGNKGFILSGVPSTAPGGVTLRLRYNNGSNINIIFCDNTGEQKFYFTEDMAQASGGYHLMINVAKNTVIPEGGVTISPMVRYVEIDDGTFEKYNKVIMEDDLATETVSRAVLAQNIAVNPLDTSKLNIWIETD